MIRRIAMVLVVLAASAAAIFATGAGPGDDGKQFSVVFDNAFGLTEGGDLRIGGVRAGETTSFGLTQTDPVRSIIYFKITEPGFDSLRSDATCAIRQQSLIGEYFVDCQPGSDDKVLPAGSQIPVENTESIVPLDLVQDVLRKPYAERFGLIIAELGTGLAGRPDDLAAALARAHPGLRETSKTLQILGDQTSTLKNFVSDSDKVVAELARNRVDVARFVKEAGRTSAISASRSADLQSGFQKLPGFLAELGPYMASLGDVADKTNPLLGDLRSASGDLNDFFDKLGPFADATQPALHALAEASKAGVPALRNSKASVHELAEGSKDAKKLGPPLRQLLVSLDDRGRATQKDPRAARSAPPEPDPTAKNAGRGFTGFEAFLDYAYWQALAINGFDDVSHFLRIYGVVDDCSFFLVSPSREQIERCNAFFGPYQAGIKNATGVINGHDFGKAESGDISGDDVAKVKQKSGKGGKGGKSGGKAKKSSVDPSFTADPDQAVKPSSQPSFDDSGAPASEGGGGLVPRVRDLVDRLTGALGGRGREQDSQPESQGSGGGNRLLDFLLGP